MARFDLMDAEWAMMEPLLPTGVRGKDRVDDRRGFNDIFWRLRTGAPLGRHPNALQSLGDLRHPLSALAQARELKAASKYSVKRLTRATCR